MPLGPQGSGRGFMDKFIVNLNDLAMHIKSVGVIAGGEMTNAALEPKYNPVSKYYEAAHQVLANNGVSLSMILDARKFPRKSC